MSTAILQDPLSVIGDDELYEVIDGQRVRTPPMAAYSVWVASRLSRFLGSFAEEQLGRVLTEALFHLPAPINRDRRPDVALVSYQRWAKNRPVPRFGNAWDVVPNVATEVVSPTDNVEELEDKIAEYFRAGVELVWVVYPHQSKIHVHRSPTEPIRVLLKNDALDGGTVVPGFRLPLAELFAEESQPDAANGAAAAQ
jgi:Uma2 family endonuclease